MRRLSHRLKGYIAKRAERILQKHRNFNYDANTNGEFELLRRMGPNMSVAFDVGANIGGWAIECARPGIATVHAFEIMPDTYRTLVANTAQHTQIVCNAFGLSASDGGATANRHPTIPQLCSLVPGVEAVHRTKFDQIAVKVQSGDRYCDEQRIDCIDFLKIDAEGTEMDVLRGLQRMLSRQRIVVVQFEYGLINIYTRCLLKDFYEFLEPLGYSVGKLYPTGVRFRPYQPEDEDFRGPNFVAVLKSRPDLIARLAETP